MIDIIVEYFFVLSKFVFTHFQTVGFVVLAGVLLFDRKQLEIKGGGLAKFIGFMTLVMLIKLATYPAGFVKTPLHYKMLSLNKFLFVFLEDAFFVMIPYYITKTMKGKIVPFLIWTLFSLVFASGHLYQGTTIAAITLAYPFFISYRYAKKTTFATVMACHFVYDCLTYLTPKIHNLLQLAQFM